MMQRGKGGRHEWQRLWGEARAEAVAAVLVGVVPRIHVGALAFRASMGWSVHVAFIQRCGQVSQVRKV